jgi:hypothetical protein
MVEAPRSYADTNAMADEYLRDLPFGRLVPLDSDHTPAPSSQLYAASAHRPLPQCHRLLLGGGDRVVRPWRRRRPPVAPAARDLRAYFEARLPGLATVPLAAGLLLERWDGTTTRDHALFEFARLRRKR